MDLGTSARSHHDVLACRLGAPAADQTSHQMDVVVASGTTIGLGAVAYSIARAEVAHMD